MDTRKTKGDKTVKKYSCNVEVKRHDGTEVYLIDQPFSAESHETLEQEICSYYENKIGLASARLVSYRLDDYLRGMGERKTKGEWQ